MIVYQMNIHLFRNIVARSQKRVVYVFVFSVLFILDISRAAGTVDASQQRLSCGINCVYAVQELLGKPIKYNDLLQVKYIGSKMGSSMQELQLAIQDHGLQSLAAKNMTADTLRQLGKPVILHVRFGPDSEFYNHWVLFVGATGSRLMIYDPPNSPTEIESPMLNERWDGAGLIISKDPIPADLLPNHTRFQWLAYLIGAIIVVFGLRVVTRKRELKSDKPKVVSVSTVALRIAIMLGTAMIVGFVYNFLSDDGLLQSSQTAGWVEDAQVTDLVPSLTVDQLMPLIADHLITIIDARYESEYKLGHIPSAINMPFDSIGITDSVDKLPRDAKIVVYCESVTCGYSAQLAKLLRKEGFTNLYLFPGGWVEWQASSKTKANTESAVADPNAEKLR
jgi:rhodanese-related sulfurtransferase/predicted double-glycine peptidase